MKVLIADDEPVARQVLREHVEAIPTLEVAGEASTGKETLQRILDLDPDVVLLDQQMPELDGLAVDALHMLAFVDTEPADQLKWGQQALAIAQASSQPAAKKWEASLRNNIGYALYQLGRYEEALDQFKQAVVLREKGEDVQATRIAHWMVGWTLRALNRTDEALEIQLRLEREREAAGAPSPYVFEELELLYRTKGDRERADHYAGLKKATAQ